MYVNRNLPFLRYIVENETGGGGGGEIPAAPSSPAAPSRTFTADDLNRVREQEKGKLYPEIERLKAEVAKRDEQIAAWNKAKQDAADASQRQQSEEADLRTLLQQKEQEWTSRLQQEADAREQAFALLEREREYQGLQSHLQSRLAEENDSIIPQLRDLVSGSSVEEIEASIAAMKERSAAILTDAQSALQQARQGMQGSRVTVPAAGPLDTDPENRSYTDADVRSMSLADYAKNRGRLLGGAASNRGRGLFG